MPRRSGKKKKGRMIKPGMEGAIEQMLANQLNNKLKDMGMAQLQNLDLPAKAAAQTAVDTDSALNQSVYTYYTETVTENGETPGGEIIQPTNVRNLQADVEAAQNEEYKGPSLPPKKPQKQLLSSRVQESPNKIVFKEDRNAGGASRQMINSARQPTNTSTAASGTNNTGRAANSQNNSVKLPQTTGVSDQQAKSSSKNTKKSKSKPSQEADPAARPDTQRTQSHGASEEIAATIVEDTQEEEKKEVQGQFFDDFDAAFGSDNDVPVLNIKKDAPKAETKLPEPQKEEEKIQLAAAQQEGAFFDDFDAAFGSDNDVPTLIIKKDEVKKPAPEQPVTSKIAPEAPVKAATTSSQHLDKKNDLVKRRLIPDQDDDSEENKNPAAKQDTEKTKYVPPSLDSPLQPTAPRQEDKPLVSAKPVDKVTEQKPVTLKAAIKSSTPPQVEQKPTLQVADGSSMLGPQLNTDLAISTTTKQNVPPPAKKTTTFSIEPIETEKPSSKDTTPKRIAQKPSYKDTPTPAEATVAEYLSNIQSSDTLSQVSTKKTTTLAKVTPTPANTLDEEELKKATVVDESDDEEEDTPSGGGGGKILMLGAVCALAAGAFFYAKKHDIQKEEIVRKMEEMVKKVQDQASQQMSRIQERFSKK